MVGAIDAGSKDSVENFKRFSLEAAKVREDIKTPPCRLSLVSITPLTHWSRINTCIRSWFVGLCCVRPLRRSFALYFAICVSFCRSVVFVACFFFLFAVFFCDFRDFLFLCLLFVCYLVCSLTWRPSLLAARPFHTPLRWLLTKMVLRVLIGDRGLPALTDGPSHENYYHGSSILRTYTKTSILTLKLVYLH